MIGVQQVGISNAICMQSILTAAGYNPDSLRTLLGVRSIDDVGLLNHAASVARLEGHKTPAAVLVRLFFLEESEPLLRVQRAVGAAAVDQLRRAGWLRVRNAGRRSGVTARVRIDPIGERHLVSDLRFRSMDLKALRLPSGDEVYPPSSDSMLLNEVVRAHRRERVLDLCTGSGIQALAQAGGAGAVVAVDINPRAAAIARLNAEINCCENIDVRLGDLYQPVRGERFDLILANPPFVTSPYEKAPSFHSGGPTGDRVLRRVIRGWDKYLEAEGRAFAVSHVGRRRGEALEDVARSWFKGFGGGALVLICETGSAVDLAAAQALFALRNGLTSYRREVERWHAYLRRHRIESISLILIAARKDARHKVEVVDAQPRVLPLPLTPTPAAKIEQWFV